MSQAHSHDNIVSTPALIAAGALVAFTLTMTATVKLGWMEREAVPNAVRAEAGVAPAVRRSLRFADGADGSVQITDAITGQLVSTIAAGAEQGGFIRGVLRGLARERHLHGIGAEPPFILTRWSDGSLSLVDQGTGRSVDLGGFGSDNSAAFAALLQGAPRS